VRVDPDGMNGQLHTDAEALILEIRRYLAAVDTFRAEHCEPTWLAELPPGGVAGARSSIARTSDAQTTRTHRP
jgi:hypothetical protein